MLITDVALPLLAFGAVAAWVVNDMAKYAPGERRRLRVDLQVIRHTRSHHYKLPPKTR